MFAERLSIVVAVATTLALALEVPFAPVTDAQSIGLRGGDWCTEF